MIRPCNPRAPPRNPAPLHHLRGARPSPPRPCGAPPSTQNLYPLTPPAAGARDGHLIVACLLPVTVGVARRILPICLLMPSDSSRWGSNVASPTTLVATNSGRSTTTRLLEIHSNNALLNPIVAPEGSTIGCYTAARGAVDLQPEEATTCSCREAWIAAGPLATVRPVAD
ncbi:hypothetical protein D1007_00029 [Hordeum vulgare]|nr:hypothetical protein D1007_00029 [Hordeum vulgare]KAI5001061.1 hypothetical protein ZWY2020_011020 [Hordeum vulgare]